MENRQSLIANGKGIHTGLGLSRYAVLPALSTALVVTLFSSPIQASNRRTTQLEQSARVRHAKELLGGQYVRSIGKAQQGASDVRKFIFAATVRSLPSKWVRSSRAVSEAVLRESKKYGFDPLFVMAVIQNESSFNPIMRGSFGEIGLMQIKPDTAGWITDKLGLEWKGAQSLLDPVTNIKIGTAYLSYLRERFDSHSRLYLSAYNMGTAGVNRSLEKKTMPKQYAFRVMRHYLRLYGELNSKSLFTASNSKEANRLLAKLDSTRAIR